MRRVLLRTFHWPAGPALLGLSLIATAALADCQPPPGKNRLACETSPYLLQHAANPVDWHPWGQDAFDKARKEGQFIFLSIGYSTCYWCHVMERESFADPDTAKLLNQNAVSIKVDREERPDVDDIYMTAVQLMTGQGGWPMTTLLTPDLKPFFGGTYLPREQLQQLITRAAAIWKEDRATLEEKAERVAGAVVRPPACPAHRSPGCPIAPCRRAPRPSMPRPSIPLTAASARRRSSPCPPTWSCCSPTTRPAGTKRAWRW
jgi:hypothetical protein